MSNDENKLCDDEKNLIIELIDGNSTFDTLSYSQYEPSADDEGWGLVPVKSATKSIEAKSEFLPDESVDEYPIIQDPEVETATALKCYEKKLGTVAQYPEIKFEGWKCYRRTRKILGWAKVCYPSDLGAEVEKALKECLVTALIACAPFVLSGALPAAYAIFKSTLVICLKTKGIDLADKVSVRLSTKTVKTRWKRC